MGYYGYLGYAGHGYGYPYAYGAYPYAYGITAKGVPFGSSTGLDAITQGAVVHHHAKRSADADADADYAYGGYPYAYGHHGYAGYPYAGLYGYAYHGVPFGSSTGLDPITQGLDASTQGLVHHKKKRSADADAYYGYTGYPYAYGHYAYNGVPFGSSTGLDALTQGLDASTQGYLPYHGYGYHGYGWGK